MPRRLCIVSGKPMRCDAFIPALTSLSRDDELEVIMDRRRGGASSEAVNRPLDERRFRPYLDLALRVDGFAFVPWAPEPSVPSPAPATATASTPTLGTAPETTATPTPHHFPPPSPLDRFAIDDEDDAYEDEAERERLEDILRYKHRRKVGPGAMIVFATAIVVAAFATMPGLREQVSLIVPAVPRWGDQPKPPGQAKGTAVATQTLPPVTEAPATEPAASPSSVAANAEGDRGREPRAPSPALPPDQSTRAPRSGSASVAPGVVASASVTSQGRVKRQWSPPLPGVPLVELFHVGASQGETYTVRVSDIAGRPLVGADILLLARMADGTAASIPLSSAADPGTYQGTMPSGRSSLVDLRVRVTTSDKRVEIPFAP